MVTVNAKRRHHKVHGCKNLLQSNNCINAFYRSLLLNRSDFVLYKDMVKILPMTKFTKELAAPTAATSDKQSSAGSVVILKGSDLTKS